MATVFYISNGPEHSSRSQSPQKKKRRRIRPQRFTNMDVLPQHACMARIREPVFSSSHVSTLLPHYQLRAAPGDCPYAYLQQHYEDEDDCLPIPTGEDQPLADGGPPLPDSSLENLREDGSVRASVGRVDGDATRYANVDGFGPSHNTPVILTGFTTLASYILEGRFHHLPQDYRRSDCEDSFSTHPYLAQISATDAERDDTNATNPLSGNVHPFAMPTVLQPDMDEDSLAVDDPRRSYDVSEFMHRWRTPSSFDERRPILASHRSQSEVGLQQSHLQISRSDLDAMDVDMQGIHWNDFGPSRGHALAARAALHPSRNAALAARVNSSKEEHRGPAQHERYYRFSSFRPPHKAHVTHFQLRNLLTAGNRSELFYANGSQVVKSCLPGPSEREVVLDFSKPAQNSASTFRVTCLVTSTRSLSDYHTDNVLLAGGFYGEYAMLNLNVDQPQPVEGSVTQAYNGLVTHVHTFPDRRSGVVQAAFCSNDRKVRTLDTRTLQWTHCFEYANAINCSATAPDGRLRVLAEDSNEVSIADTEKGGVLVSLREHTNHGFACAWSPDGRHVTTGAEDGTVRVWDARNWSRSVQALASVISCPRSLHFTEDGRLVVAENEDVVTIYDTKDFEQYQDIRFFGSIAGVAVLDGGDELVIANADKTVGGLLAFQRGIGYGTTGRRRRR